MTHALSAIEKGAGARFNALSLVSVFSFFHAQSHGDAENNNSRSIPPKNMEFESSVEHKEHLITNMFSTLHLK